MIYYGAQTLLFLCGIVFTLIVLYIVTAIVMLFMRHKLKKAMKEWEEAKKELEDADMREVDHENL